MTDENMEQFAKWISFNLPENCPCINVSFSKEIAEMQIEKFKAKPLYMNERRDFLSEDLFITYGGTQAPSQRLPEEADQPL